VKTFRKVSANFLYDVPVFFTCLFFTVISMFRDILLCYLCFYSIIYVLRNFPECFRKFSSLVIGDDGSPIDNSIYLSLLSDKHYINGIDLSNHSSCTDLGVVLSQELSFHKHINSFVSKARFRVSILFRGFVSRSRSRYYAACIYCIYTPHTRI
jgi:hypothetical protein